jgi:hypothetical protein
MLSRLDGLGRLLGTTAPYQLLGDWAEQIGMGGTSSTACTLEKS